MKRNYIFTKDITLSTSTKIKLLLFSDDQFIIADSEDNLQRSTHITKHNKKFWSGNIITKILDDEIFRTRPVRFKIVVDNKCLRKVRNFKFSSIKLYNALAVPILLFGSEILIPRKRIKSIDISRDGTLQENRRVHNVLTTKMKKKFWKSLN